MPPNLFSKCIGPEKYPYPSPKGFLGFKPSPTLPTPHPPPIPREIPLFVQSFLQKNIVLVFPPIWNLHEPCPQSGHGLTLWNHKIQVEFACLALNKPGLLIRAVTQEKIDVANCKLS